MERGGDRYTYFETQGQGMQGALSVRDNVTGDRADLLVLEPRLFDKGNYNISFTVGGEVVAASVVDKVVYMGGVAQLQHLCVGWLYRGVEAERTSRDVAEALADVLVRVQVHVLNGRNGYIESRFQQLEKEVADLRTVVTRKRTRSKK